MAAAIADNMEVVLPAPAPADAIGRLLWAAAPIRSFPDPQMD